MILPLFGGVGGIGDYEWQVRPASFGGMSRVVNHQWQVLVHLLALTGDRKVFSLGGLHVTREEVRETGFSYAI